MSADATLRFQRRPMELHSGAGALDVQCLWTFIAINQIELDSFAFDECLIAISHD